jgi:hypothetical protein
VEVKELIENLDEAIANADAEIATLLAKAEAVDQRINRLRAQRQAVVSAVSEVGQEEDAPKEVAVARHLMAGEWRSMPRTVAVERALRETAAPMSLKDIAKYLATRGRDGDSLSYISAAISHLRNSGGVPIHQVTRGVWRLDTETHGSDSPPELENLLSGGHSPSRTISRVLRGMGETIPSIDSFPTVDEVADHLEDSAS